MAVRKKKQPQSILIKTQLTFLSALVILLAIITSHPWHPDAPLVTTTTIGQPVIASKSSRLVPKASADSYQEDYCVTVPVLLYHHVQPLYLSNEKQQDALTVGVEYFDMHMNYLSSNGYVSLSADKLITALLNREELPPKSVIVTIDDGYEDNYLYAFPILKKYNIIGNFMIPTGLIGKEDYMTWDELKEMANSPLVRLYNHTTNHVDVGNARKDVAEKEIKNAQDVLARETGFNYPIFTYPYGTSSDSAREVLKHLGFAGAYTTQHGFTQCRSFIYDLHRDHAGNLPLSSYGL